jgi:hypothetical protein
MMNSQKTATITTKKMRLPVPEPVASWAITTGIKRFPLG